MNIAIAGYGIEGKANYAYWNTPENTLTIVDAAEKVDDLPEGVQTILGADAFERLNGFDMVVRTASLAPSKIQTDGKIWSATNEFFTKCPAPIIGVTGTKGKGTTSSLIAAILRAAGKTVHLVGNIGLPALGELRKITADDIVVFELSSFQLWDLEKSPHVGVVLMIEPDHLNVHDGFTDYVAAKANIRRHQSETDLCVYHPNNEFSREIADATSRGSVGRFGIADDGFVYVKDGYFYVKEQKICSVEALRIPGAHNLDNACAAISAVLRFTKDTDTIEQGLQDFEGLPHRLKFIAAVGGVRYFDDSIATTPGSAIAAIHAFSEPRVLILGGSDKGGDYAELIALCKTTSTKVVAMGETGPRIAEQCRAFGVECRDVQGGMAEVVGLATEMADGQGVVLLSPAAASFDMFASYADRGDQFAAAVRLLNS